ncbi:hypothetical protein CR66_00795 [Campylobacter mucosalis]|uniref:DUF3137 domain-containing protein n=1 Tax=Campylobacter mucosalis TaxID=202 RepID=UPI0004DA6239|nr:DUF3137 domain-containing protein [Campylobacter mucosalis]KEA46425.1 hypothetical protein CR66_00795 [Campylobacter mucosalis]
MASVTLYSYLNVRFTKNIRADFKEYVMPKILKEIEPNLSYQRQNFIDQNEFFATEIFSTDYSKYSGNDLMVGKVEDVLVKFSDVLIKKEIQNDKQKDEIVVFCGICFIAKFNKKIKATTQVIDKMAKFSFGSGEKAVMDDILFERYFRTYTHDQVVARYLLTPKFMQNLCKLKELFKAPVCAVFMGENLYLYIDLRRDSFELDMKKPIDIDRLNAYKSEVKIFIDIVKVLNLNDDLFVVSQKANQSVTDQVSVR